MSRVATARNLASGGRGIAWVFFVPVTLLVVIAIDAVVRWPTSVTGAAVSLDDLPIVVMCFLLWYFVVGRVPNWIAVHNVRRQADADAQVWGIDVFTKPQRSMVATARFPGGTANVAVASTQYLQLWAGKRDFATPIRTIPWRDVESVQSAPPSGSSLVAIRVAGSTLPFYCSFVDNRVFSTLRIRWRVRARLIALLEARHADVR